MSASSPVPLIDIAPFATGDAAAKRRVADAVDRACRDIGFLIIAGHGVDPALIDRVDRLSRAFFDLPMAEKLKVARPAPDVTRGYIGIEEESVARSRGEKAPGDLNESFMIGPPGAGTAACAGPYFTAPEAGKHFAPNLWPAAPHGYAEALVDYYGAMSDLAGRLMRIFALALDLPETFFEAKIDREISRLRIRNYPAPEVAPVPGQLRAGAHSDYGSLTILKAEAKPGGLQVYDKNGQWSDVPIVPGTFIVNLGDLMERWTNDEWVSTLHRVVNPPLDAASMSRRQSIVFFHNPNYDAVIECIPSCTDAAHPPKYPTVTSGQHLREKFTSTQAANYA